MLRIRVYYVDITARSVPRWKGRERTIHSYLGSAYSLMATSGYNHWVAEIK